MSQPMMLTVTASDGYSITEARVQVTAVCADRIGLAGAFASVYEEFYYDVSLSFQGQGLRYTLPGGFSGLQWLVLDDVTGELSGFPTLENCSPGVTVDTAIIYVVVTDYSGRKAYATIPVELTCEIQPIRATPIPPATAIIDENLFLDVSERFPYKVFQQKRTLSIFSFTHP